MSKCLIIILLFFYSANALGAVIDRFDYPFGPPNGMPRCPGTSQCSGGWQNVQDFRVNNHLGEDWNYGLEKNDDLGKPIYAIANGKVVYAQDGGANGAWKGVIIIQHTGSNLNVPGGASVSQVRSMYGHLDVSKINNWVTVGSTVTRGQQIGIIGPTPNGSTGPHLHFEIRTDASIEVGHGYSSDPTGWIDPSDFIDANRQSAPLKFNISNVVKVFGTGGIGLRAWTNICSGTNVNKPDGSIGTIQGGPVDCGGYMQWKIRWSGDSIDRWSAEDWLAKISASTPGDLNGGGTPTVGLTL